MIYRGGGACGSSGSGVIRNIHSSVKHISHSHREGHGLILVYSITSREAFERLEVHHQAMLNVKKGRPVFMLVGSQCDKKCERKVSAEEGNAKAREFGCGFSETSAKTGENVEKPFADLIRILRSRKEATQCSTNNAPSLPAKTQESRIKSLISRTFKVLRRREAKSKVQGK